MTRTQPATDGTPLRHGTLTAYGKHHCRCTACTTARRTYDTNRARRTAYGTWQPRVSAIPARNHLLQLIAADMTWDQISTAAGVSEIVIRRLLTGPSGQAPAGTISKTSSIALLRVPTPGRPTASPRKLTDATQARRQLQALTAVGWPMRAISRHCTAAAGLLPEILHGRLRTVSTATAAAIDLTYNRLWDADPVGLRVRAADVRAARRLAARHLWALPLAWDDDSIADPGASPNATGRCGEPGGYYDHSQLGTPACQPCRDAVAAAARERKTRRRARTA